MPTTTADVATVTDRSQPRLADLSTRVELSSYVKISVPTLARWAGEGKGPRFVRAGSRVLYKRDDVLNWIDSLAESS